MAEAEKAPPRAENGDGEARPEEGEGETEDGEELPDLLELVDAAAAAESNAADLAVVFRKMGRRVRASPEDRDLLTDFEGLVQICTSLANPPHNWKGQAMIAFCNIMPDVCRTSVLNRGALRDAGFLAATVELLRSAVETGTETETPLLGAEKADIVEGSASALATAQAASLALSALCTASDGNKMAAAQVVPDAGKAQPEGEKETKEHKSKCIEEDSVPCVKPGAMELLLLTLEKFAGSAALQTEAISALRSLITDDDSRTLADCEKAAVDLRELATSDALFPRLGAVVERGFALCLQSPPEEVKLREQVLLLLRELARDRDRIEELAIKAKFLKPVLASLASEDSRIVRATLAVLRGFAINESVRDELSLSCETQRFVRAIRKHLGTATVCEQGFGLLVNLIMRNPSMASFLNNPDHEVVSLGKMVLEKHGERPDVSRSVVQMLWNVGRQNESALSEMKEIGLFEDIRKFVAERKDETRWAKAVDAAMTLLREFKADDGLRKNPQYNKYY